MEVIDLLELIFRGFAEWGYNMTWECWEYFSSVLWDIMSMDFAYLKQHMPIIDTIMEIFLAVGWALLIGNLVFQAAKTMLSGIGFEGEDPKLLFTRTFVFSFLLLASPQICNLCLNLTSAVINLLKVPDAVNVSFLDESSFGGLSASWLLVIICGLIVMFQSFKLIFEMAERYLILAVLTISAPLAFGMGGSRNTSDIFSGWCRMYGSMCLLMVMNVVFVKMLLSVLSSAPSGLDVLPWMALVLSTVKVAKKIDNIITRIGLNPAITGDPLGRTFPGTLSYMLVRSAASQVSKTLGKSSGGAGKGHIPNTPPGAVGGPRGGSGGGETYIVGMSSSQRSGQQNAAYQNQAQVSATKQDAMAQTGTTWTPAQDQIVSPSYSGGITSNRADMVGTRRTSVPSGLRSGTSQTKTGRGASEIPSPHGREQPASNASQYMLGHEKAESRSASKSGPAGKEGVASSTGARFTQVNSQQSRSGGINSTVQAKEQNHLTVSPNSSQIQKPPGATPLNDMTVNGTLAQQSRAALSESRYTHRDLTAANAALNPSGAVQTQVHHGQSVQPQTGTAGTARTFRNAPVSSYKWPEGSAATGTAQIKSEQQRPAPQEPRGTSRATKAADNGADQFNHPGPAGIAENTARISMGQNAAHRSGGRGRSTPMAEERAGKRKPLTSPSAMQKSMIYKEGISPTNGPGRGDRYGRKK